MAFGYGFSGGKGVNHFSLINKDKKVISTFECPLTSGRMIHDFAATENYVIFPDLPLEFSAQAAKEGKFVIRYDKN